jgi:midasin
MKRKITNFKANNYDKLKLNIDLYTQLQTPVCVYGEVGKTSILKSFIPDLFIIDSREITDIRNLVGFYAIDEGEISYVNGLLIDAMKSGSNLLIRNIDSNLNLLYFLNSVIRHRKIVNSKGENIVAERSFNLFFTAEQEFKANGIYFVGPVEYSWKNIYSYDKKTMFFLDKIISIFNESCTKICSYKENKNCYKCCLSGDSKCFDGVSLCLANGRNLCKFHYKKINQLHKCIIKYNKWDYESRLVLYDCICNLFLRHDCEELLTVLNLSYYPDIILYDTNIAKTYAYILAIRKLILNIKMNKYSLLLGETGVGKTSVIQYICANAKRYFGYSVDLKVVNMSPDYDGYDLVGGYSSLDISKKILDLYKANNLEKPKILNNTLLLQDLIIKIGKTSEIELLEKCINNKANFIWKDGILVDAMKRGYWILLDEINLCNEDTLGMIESILSKGQIVNYEKRIFEKINIHPNFMLFACMNPGNDFGKKNYDTNQFNKVEFYDFTNNISDIKLVLESYGSRHFSDVQIEILSDIFYKIKQMIRKKELSNKVEPLLSGRTLIRCLESIKKNPDMKVIDIFSVFVLTQFDLQSRSIVFSMLNKLCDTAKDKLIPTYLDLDFILTPKTQLLLYDIKTGIKLNCPILLQGDTSTGKTSIIFYIAEKLGKKVIRINNHEHTEAADYLGNYVTTKNGIEFKESIFIKSIRNGWWVILDELNLAQSDVLEVLNRLLDDNKEIYLPQNDELVKAHEDFRLFATQNIEYSGRKGISKAFRNRFIEIFFGEKDENEILEILHLKTGLPKSFCTKMVQVYVLLKNQRNVDSLITLRDLFKWAKRVPQTMYEVYEIGLSIIYERQRLETDKMKVLEIFRSVFNKLDSYNFDYSENTSFNLPSELMEKFSNRMILTKSIVKLIKLLNAATKCKDPILIIGETGIGKTKICEIFSEIIGQKFLFVNMHSGTESSDFVGNFVLDKSEVRWKDGLLLEAMKNGDCFLIDEINLAEDAVLERLNSLLEDKREIFVTEIDKNYKAHDNFRIFATMNPGNDFGKKELSPALRNRFTEIYFELPYNEIQEICDLMLITKNIPKNKIVDKFMKSITSLRKFELFCEFVEKLKNRSQGLVYVDDKITEEVILQESFNLVLNNNDEVLKETVEDENTMLSIYPYRVNRVREVQFDFENKTSVLNLKKLLRALVVQKGIMLEGEPGVGKTSIVNNLAKIVGKKCIRINLSEQTELPDLVGTYLPVENGIEFIKSELAMALINGWWIILDEINLCSQSVIEGLNSVLDYRKSLVLPECVIKVHPETKIFATMNPYNSLNGRKILPKSFIDRFIKIYMSEYTQEDMKQILEKLFGSYTLYPECSLRENIRKNTCVVSKGETEYIIDKDHIRIGNFTTKSYLSNINNFVFIHSQVSQLESILLALYNKIPLIISGGFGKGPIIEFVSKIFNLNFFDFMCHKDIDTSDILGQYHKGDSGSFEWKDSLFIEFVKKGSLIILHNPELIEKSIFDRCNSLFESEKFINIYEKGFDTDVIVHDDTRFIMFVDNIMDLSPALRDRCLVVNLSNELSYIDAWKIYFRNLEIYNDFFQNKNSIKKLKIEGSDYESWINNEKIEIKNFDLEHKMFTKFMEIPKILHKKINFVYNELIEERIDNLFNFECREYIFDESKIKYVNLYKSIRYKVSQGCNDEERLCNLLKINNNGEEVKCLTFIKNAYLDVLENVNENAETCRLSFPHSIQNLKEEFLSSFRNKTLGDLNRLEKLSKLLSQVSFNFSVNFDKEYFNMIRAFDYDPLKAYKEYITFEKTKQENVILTEIHKNMKSIYKYGRGGIRNLIEKLDQLNIEFNKEVNIVNSKLNRNFEDFKKRLCTVDLCSYVQDRNTRDFFDSFDDLFDYFLIYLFNAYKNSRNCSGYCKKLSSEYINTVDFDVYINKLYNTEITKMPDVTVNYKTLVANFLLNKDILNIINQLEYSEFGIYLCKFIYSIKNLKGLDIKNLIFEACLNKNSKFLLHRKIDNQLNIPEIYIDECLKNILNINEVSYILDSRNCSINISEKIVKEIGELSSLPLFTNPEIVYEKITEYLKENKIHKNLNHNILSLTEDLEQKISDFILDEDKNYKKMNNALKLLEKYFRKPDSVTWLSNYRYFIFLEVHKFNPELAERFFYDCQVYEFYDRMFFAELRALISTDNMFYNLVLQYKAFEVENLVDGRIKEAQNKLRKEPNLFRKIREEVIDFVTLPVTNILDLKFNKPQCSCGNKKFDDKHLLQFIKIKDGRCICEEYIELSDNFNRSYIQDLLCNNPDITKKDLLDLFYNRNVTDKFSYPEVCLSKVINKITDDPTHLKLIQIALDIPFPPFLYFIFNFCDEDNIEYEDGTGIKGGTGEKNISDKIEDEEEISDEFCDKNDVEEDDGISFENEGSMSTVDEQEDDKNDVGVDGSDKEEEIEDEDKNDKEEEYKDERMESEGLGESSNNEEEGLEVNDKEVNDKEEGSGDEVLDGENDNFDKNDIINEYKYKEGNLNQNQTCNDALDYERKVFGSSLEQALCPGEGTEEVEGNKEKGEGIFSEYSISINQKESYSEKLVLMLRNILESNKFNKYKGDYKSGKKLNMKRLIPYIASDYRRDKIWMKRRKSDKKEYVLRLFVDNSRSMYSQEMIDTLLVLFSRIRNSFKALNIPVEVYKFGNECTKCEISSMTFTDNETNIDWIEEYTDGINIILTDGVFQKTGFYNKNFLVILIDRNEVLKMSKVSVTDGNIFIQKYLDLFSLKYCVIKNIDELENTFVIALSDLILNL